MQHLGCKLYNVLITYIPWMAMAQWRMSLSPPPPGSLLATDRSKAVVLVWFLLNVFGVGVSCRKLYYFVVYLYVDGSGSITSVGEERDNLSAVVYL